MKTNIIFAFIALATFALGITVGHYAARRNVITYSVPVLNGEYRQAVHMDWPTYGLPIAEFQMFLTFLDSGNTNNLRQNLDLCLDAALFDAAFRRPKLPHAKRTRVDKTILRVAEYRRTHPRSNILPTRKYVDEQWWHDGYSYFSKRQETVDALLEEVRRMHESHNKASEATSGSAPSAEPEAPQG